MSFVQQTRTFFRTAASNYANPRRNQLRLHARGRVLSGLQSVLPCSVDELMGYVMESAVATCILPDEHFVVQVDGQERSEHRRFVDALIAGLILRNEFPQHEVKVLEADTSAKAADVVH